MQHTEYFNRLSGRGSPTRPLLTSDFTLAAEFGDGASIALTAGSTELAGEATITCGGSGQGANPLVTMTFPGGTWAQENAGSKSPIMIVSRGGGSQATIPMSASCDSGAAYILFNGTAAGTETYTFSWHVIG